MRITSPDFAPGSSIPAKFTCKGADVVPRLAIDDVPPTAKSLALVMEDPDAPRGNWVHWTIWDIPAGTTTISGSVAGATEGVTTPGTKGWHGPCPPSGTHRYFFRLYALDRKLGLPSSSDRAALAKSLEGHVVAQAELMGTVSH